MRIRLFLFSTIIFSFGLANAQEPKLMLPIGHTSSITTKAFSSDGKRILTGSSDDKKANVWDSETGKLLCNINGHLGEPFGFSFDTYFSPGSKRIVTHSRFSEKLWNAESGKLLVILRDSANEFENFSRFSADGKKIITPDGYSSKIRDSQNGKLLAELYLPSKCLRAIFSEDGQKILTTEVDSTVKIWDAENYKILFSFKGDDLEYIFFSQDSKRILSTKSVRNALTGDLIDSYNLFISSISPDGRKILLSFENNTLGIWNVENRKILRTFEYNANNGYKSIPNFSRDGKKIIGVSKEEIIIWDTETGIQLSTILNNDESTTRPIFSPDGKKIITYSDDKTTVWDAETGIRLFSKSNYDDSFKNPEFSSNGKKIVTRSDYSNAKIWDAKSGNLLSILASHAEGMQSAQFSPHGRRIATSSENSTKIWDASSGKLLLTIKKDHDNVPSPGFSNDGKKIVIPSSTFSFSIWDVLTGSELFSPVKQDSSGEITEEELLRVIKNGIVDAGLSAQYSPDDQSILIAFGTGNAKIWDVKKEKFVLTINHKENYRVYNAHFSSDGKRIVTASQDHTAKIVDSKTNKVLFTIRNKGDFDGFISAQFSKDGKKIVTASETGKIKLWDGFTGKFLIDLNGHASLVYSANFSHDGIKVVSAPSDGTPIVWNAFTGKFLTNLKGHTARVRSAAFSTDDKNIITASEDGTAKVWDAHNGKLIYTFIALDSSDYLVQLPSNYYLASTNAPKLLHYITPDLKVITFEQLDLKYNRPDLVLKAIGNTDTSLINSYHKAFEKRIKRLGFDTTFFTGTLNVPEAELVNRDNTEYEQTKDKISLHIKAKDSTFNLDRFNLWINEVPLFGTKGITLKDRNKKDFDTTLTVTLSDSLNIIETSVTNVSGLESYRIPLQVNYTPVQKAKEKLYFVGVATDKFVEDEHNLQYSVKDIRNLAQNLKKKYGDDMIILDTLFDEKVSIASVVALKQKLLQTSINDKVILSFSGHGLLSDSLDYYLSTYNVNFKKPEEGGLPYEELENLLDGIPARKKLMLIDACHSGEVDKEEMLKMKRSETSLKENGIIAHRGTEVFNTDSTKMGMGNSFQLMQQLFVNVGRSTGATIISAAGGLQLAQEGGGRENGVFTFSILEYMKNHPSATVTELKNYVNKRVPQLTDGLQQPTSRTENKLVDWRVW